MPITRVEYNPRPYVRGGNLGELLRLRGRDQAEAELRAGDIQARMWSDLGQNISNTIGGIAKERQEAPERARRAEMDEITLSNARRERDAGDRLNRQDTAFMALLEQQPTPDPKEVMSIYGPQRGMQIAQGLHAFGELQTGAVKDARDTAGRLAIGLTSLSPQLQAQMWPAVRQAAIKGGLGSEEDIPEQFTPEYAKAVIGWSTGQQATPANTPTREIKTRNEDGSETVQIVEDAPGFTATSAAPKPTDFEWVTRAGRPVQIPKGTAQHGDRPYQPPSTAQPSYSWVQMPDGTPAYLTPDETRRAKAMPLQQNRVPTESERRAGGLYPQMEQALTTIDALESKLTETDLYQFSLPQDGIFGAFNRNKLSDTGKRYLQALEQFTEARLRPLSGATIRPDEYAQDRRTYARQFGETDELAAQRKESRRRAHEGLRVMAGRADPPKATAGTSGPTKGERRTINGELGEWDGRQWVAVDN